MSAISGIALNRGLLRALRVAASPAAIWAAVFLNGSSLAAEAQSAEPTLDVQRDDELDDMPDDEPEFAHDFSTYQPTAKATRIEPSEAPTIDGLLNDPAWAKAEIIDEFYQLDPDTGRPSTERTEVRFLYDAETLYVGIYAFDKEPDRIIATNRSRDGMLGVDDTVRIYLDPLNTRRNSYYFEVNAAGARADALIQNNTDYIREWNTIWSGKAMIVDDGYIVEMAIPFRNLAYDPSKPDWVIEFSRNIRRKAERIRWSMISAAVQFSDITRSGTLTGITGIDQGIGLDLQLFGSLRYRYDWQDPKREIVSFRAGGNAFYKITPLLTGTLTVNPDFSDAPLDLRGSRCSSRRRVTSSFRTWRRSSSAAADLPPASITPTRLITASRSSRAISASRMGCRSASSAVRNCRASLADWASADSRS